MKKILLIMCTLILSAYSFAQISLNSLDVAYIENFDGMGIATPTSFPTGWTAIRAAGSGTIGATLSLSLTDGSANSGGVYNVATTNNPDRALGSLASGSTVPAFGASFLNNTGSTVTSIDFAGILEQWRSGSNATVSEILPFEYSFDATSLSTGEWTPLTGMNLFEILTGANTAAAVDGNAASNRAQISATVYGLNWANGATLWIRWTDTDNTNSDGLFAIDDFSITPKIATPPGILTLTTPNGGEIYDAGQNVTIKWSAQDVTHVKFDVLTSEGWENFIEGPIDATLGELLFTIPANAWNWNGYKIRIVNYSTDLVNDESNATFTIKGHDKELLYEEFNSGFGIMTPFSVVGDQVWTATSNTYAEMNGYSNTPAPAGPKDNNDWLVSPAINMDNSYKEILEFITSNSFSGPILKVKYSTNYTGDITSATWTELTYEKGSNNDTWTHSGYIDMSAIDGIINLAFEYNSNPTDGAARWRITDIYLSGINGSATSINTQEKEQQIIISNPIFNKMKVVTDKTINVITFYNISGKVAKQITLPTSNEVQVSDLQNGIYLVQIKFNDGTSTTEKVIKK